MSEALRVAGVDVAPGTRQVVRLPVTTRLDGSELSVPVHVVRGASTGPTLVVVSALHGNQWAAIDAVRRVVTELDPAHLRGTLLAVPVGNPLAFERLSRMTPDDSDSPDLNRVFPGGTTWITEQIATVLSTEVVDRADALLNYHTGPWGSALATVDYIYGLPDTALAERTAELAVAYGFPSIRGFDVLTAGSFPCPRSIGGHAIARGIPNIAPNIGGSGFAAAYEDDWRQANVTGIRNVMIHLGMLDGSIALPDRFFVCKDRGHRVVPRHGGLVEPVLGPDAMLTEIEAGTLLGRVVSPYTFEVLEELRAPVDGLIFGVPRFYPARPGDWAYFVADTGLPQNQWVSSAESVTGTARRIIALEQSEA